MKTLEGGRLLVVHEERQKGRQSDMKASTKRQVEVASIEIKGPKYSRLVYIIDNWPE